jgi:hypothetical protein
MYAYGSAMGWEIITSTRKMTISISDETHCCERASLISMPKDGFDHYLGAEVISVESLDQGNGIPYQDDDEDESNEDNTSFLSLHTDRGSLYLGVCNQHNGYYSHAAFITIGDKKSEFYL